MSKKKQIKTHRNHSLTGVSAYLLGPIPILGQIIPLFLLIIKGKNPFIRFHALQSLIFFISFYIVILILTLSLIGLVLMPFLLIFEFVIWILLMYMAFQGELFKIPLLGDILKKKAKKKR